MVPRFHASRAFRIMVKDVEWHEMELSHTLRFEHLKCVAKAKWNGELVTGLNVSEDIEFFGKNDE